MDNFKKKIKAVIFDMDGTILNTETAWQRVTREMLGNHGITDFTKDDELFLKSLSGIGLTNSVIAIKEKFALSHSVEELASHKLKLADHYLSTGVEFMPGFERFHKLLQEHNIPTSIATNASAQHLKQLATSMHLHEFFGPNMYCVEDVNNKAKPDPAVFLHAAEKLGVQPHECIVFEDSLYGFQAARAAGMTCIAVKNELNKNLLDQVYDAIESYHNAEEVLKKV